MDQDKIRYLRSSKYEQPAEEIFQKYDFRFFSVVFFKQNASRN